MLSSRLRIGRIDHVLLLVRNMDEAVAFYENALGCDVENLLPKHAMAELRAGDSHLDLVDIAAPAGAWANPPAPGGRNVDHVALTVESHDAATLREHLRMHGVDVVEERVEAESVSLYVRDPSGNTIELITPCAPTANWGSITDIRGSQA